MPLSGATILQVIPDLSAGGAERTTVEVAQALTAAGARALVVSAGGRLEGELKRAGGELIAAPSIGSKNPAEMWMNARRLAKLIRAQKVDLVHARSRAPAWSALSAARGAKRPFVTTYHGIYNARSPLKRFYNSVMARGDVVIANSEFTAAHVRREHPEAASRLVVIPRGVDIAQFSPEAVPAQRRDGLASDWLLPHDPAFTVLLPGRLTKWKGQRDAIEAMALLDNTADFPAFRLILAGDAQGRDGYEAGLRDLISARGLDGRVFIVGHCPDMPAAFSLADVVIAPSREPEAFGRVAAEAGAMGVAVVAADHGGQREVIVNGETGLLTPPGDVPALAAAIGDLARRGPEGRRKVGAAAQARIRAAYTTASLQRATLDVYAKLLGRQTADGAR